MEVVPYSRLAEHYDRLMGHVHYDFWASSILRILKRHKHKPESLLELGAGTGKLAGYLQIPSLQFQVHSDLSLPMVQAAGPSFAFPRLACDATAIPFADQSFDLILMCYDAVNYLSPRGFRALMEEAFRVLKPGGFFLFDVTTEENSLNWFEDYCDAFEASGGLLVRRSAYDREKGQQHNYIDVFEPMENSTHYQRLSEHHCQYIYPVPTLCQWIEECGMELRDLLDSNSLRDATPKSERIHFVLRRGDS